MSKSYILYIFLLQFIIGANKYENLQVLKFESNKELMKYMKSISKDLGVKCSFCHNMKNKAEDTPKKEVARSFIQIVNHINSDILAREDASEVTCWTCHRGKQTPDNDITIKN